MAVTTDLRDRVVAALTAAGYDHAEGTDGFATAVPRNAPMDRVVVIPVLEGALQHMGTPGVRAKWVAQFAQALFAAGFGVAVVRADPPAGSPARAAAGWPTAVMVADTQGAADRAVAELPDPVGGGRG